MVENFEIIPPRQLQPWVERIWSISGDTSGDHTPAKQLLPDGSVEILFRFDGGAAVTDRGREEPIPAACVVGQLRSPLSITLTGTLDLVGIRCRPTGAAALLGVPMHELVGKASPLEGMVADLPTDRLAETTDQRARIAIVSGWIQKRLVGAADRCPIRFAAEAILASGGHTTVAQIAHGAAISERQLERRFKTVVGVSPKSLARITRFARAFNLAQSAARPDWTHLAARTGYCDQAHLCRDFSLFAGCSPQQVKSDTSVDRWCSNLDAGRFSSDMSDFSNTHRLRCA